MKPFSLEQVEPLLKENCKELIRQRLNDGAKRRIIEDNAWLLAEMWKLRIRDWVSA